MLIRRKATTLLQIFCELLLYTQVIFKSMRVADDNSNETLSVNGLKESGECSGFVSYCDKLSYNYATLMLGLRMSLHKRSDLSKIADVVIRRRVLTIPHFHLKHSSR